MREEELIQVLKSVCLCCFLPLVRYFLAIQNVSSAQYTVLTFFPSKRKMLNKKEERKEANVGRQNHASHLPGWLSTD
jgi:hypothetical protein